MEELHVHMVYTILDVSSLKTRGRELYSRSEPPVSGCVPYHCKILSWRNDLAISHKLELWERLETFVMWHFNH